MAEAARLDYAVSPPRQPWSVAAIIALILGLGSGPIEFEMVRLSGTAYGISIVGSICVAIIGIPVSGFCLWAYFRLTNRRLARGRILAMIGLIATSLWAVGLIALFSYIDSQLT
jgi:hypothetical protein